jgi:uncharacterized protein YjbI with pentapeptide repeats
MNITRLAALRGRIGVFLIALAAFAGGIGVYAAAQAFWPRLLVWWPWLLAGVAGLGIYGAWWLWWRLPQREVDRRSASITDPKARADVEDNIRKTIGQLLGGAAVLVGAGFAYLQFQQQQQAAHDLLISNQVAKGFELLGNKDKQIQQRLGGIYALEGVMNTSREYYQPVLEALCAFVREETKAKSDKDAPASDIQAALWVIGRRTEIDMNRAGLSNATTLGEAFKKASFPEIVQFIGMGKPNLKNAHIPKADLAGALLRDADLTGTDLSDANLWGANLSGADLTGTDLRNANLLSANLTGAKLTKADLTGTDLTGADLTGADLTKADLTKAGLGRVLSDDIPIGADLTKADLRGAQFLTQQQLDKACGTDVKLDPGLTIKPCSP